MAREWGFHKTEVVLEVIHKNLRVVLVELHKNLQVVPEVIHKNLHWVRRKNRQQVLRIHPKVLEVHCKNLLVRILSLFLPQCCFPQLVGHLRTPLLIWLGPRLLH